jgi:hypothetical protein
MLYHQDELNKQRHSLAELIQFSFRRHLIYLIRISWQIFQSLASTNCPEWLNPLSIILNVSIISQCLVDASDVFVESPVTAGFAVLRLIPLGLRIHQLFIESYLSEPIVPCRSFEYKSS